MIYKVSNYTIENKYRQCYIVFLFIFGRTIQIKIPGFDN
jgi:hypothetical protein